MKQSSLTDLFLNQTKALYWVVDLDYRLIYANKSYLSLIKEITGTEKKLNDTVFVEGFGEGYIEKWKTYYNRAIKGEYFEVEEHFYNAESGEIEYGQVTFEPLKDDNHNFFAVACLSKDITRIVKQKSEATQLMDASLDVFCSFNESGNFVYVSAAAKALWGYEPKELVGTPYAALVLEEDLPDTKAIATAVMNGEETKSFINRYKKKDGSIAYNLWSARWDEHTKLMYCTARDGKEKIEQEKEVLQSEQRFKALVQEGSDLIGILDIDGNYSYVSPTSSSVLGISPEEFIGRNAFDFIHPDDAERVLVNLQKIATENKVTVEPFRFQNHKNEWRWIESILINMLDNPVINGIVANSRDVTEKIEEKHHLKLLESVITNTSDAVLITEAEPQDEPGPKILYVNEAFTKMTGYSAEEVIGKTPRILQGPKSNNVELAKLGKALRNWESYECTTINYKKNGEEFWINFKVTPVKNEKGWYTQWIAIERDVTEQKQKELEKELLGKISLNFSTENDLASSTKALCETICGFGTFDFVELWLPGFDDQEIKLMASTYSSEQAIAFQEESREVRAFARGQGLQGIVWNTKSTLLWEKSSKKDDFIRKEAAKKAGINSALGIPLFYNDNVVGVLTVATHLGLPFLKKYVQLFEQLEHFIGSEINRKRLENDLSHLYDAIPDIVSVGDFRGRFLRINKAGYDLLGYTEEEILYQGFEKFIHPDDLDAAISEMARIQTGESNFGFELRFLTKSGEVLWLSWYCKANVEEGLIYCSAKNITEEKKLRELNRQANNLAKVGSWEYDLIKGILFWSPEVYHLHDMDPGTFVPNVETAIDFYKEEHKSYVTDEIYKSLSEGVYLDYEAVIITRSKKEKWVRVIGSPEFVEGKCVKFIGSFQDTTDRRETEYRLKILSDNLPGVVFQYLLHPDGSDEFRYISKGSEKIWGYSSEEVSENIDLVWDQIKAGGQFEAVKQSIKDAIENKSRWSIRYRAITPEGEERILQGLGSPEFLTDGTVLFNSMVLDVTQEAKNEELLKQTAQVARVGSWEMNLINQEGDSMYWSPLLKELVEVDDNYEPTLTGGIEFHVGESKDRIQKALERLITEGIEFDEEILLRTAKGNERWSRAIGKSELVNNKRSRIFGSYQNIHENKIAALELEKSLKSLQDYKFALDQSAIIAFTDRKGVITSANDNFCKISQYDRAEIIGNTHRLINSNYHTKAFFKDLWKTISSGEVWRGEIKNKTKSGSYYWMDTTIVPFLNKNNKPTQYLAIRFDITSRKKAELEKNSFQTTIENSLNEIYMFDVETFKFLYVNEGALKNLGYTHTEVQALTPLDLKPKFDVNSFNKLVDPLLKNKNEKIIFFTDHKRKDGSLYPVEVHLQLVSEGVNERFLAIILDITERKKAEEIILKANERFEKVTEATNDAIWDWDILNDTFYRSKAIEKFFGKAAQKTMHERDFWKDKFHPDDVEKISASVKKALSDPSCTKWELEYRVFNDSGKMLYVIDRGVIIRDKQGKATRMVGSMTNISDLKQSEQKNKFKANLLNTIGQAAVATDLNGIVNYWNRAAEQIYGWKKEEAIGKEASILTPSDVNEKQVEEILKMVQDGKMWSGEFEVKKKGGAKFPVRVSNSPVYDENNEIAGMIGVSSDITEEVKNRKLLKQYTKELERSNEELEQFAFIASHDLQEPLRMVSGFMDQLNRKYGDQLDEKAHQYIHFATDGAKRMKQIIFDLLEYSRSTRHAEKKQEVNVNDVIAEFKQLRRKLISEKSAIIKSTNLPTLKTYKAAITQIFHCLLDNALKYSKSDTAVKIKINVEEKKNEWKFSIADNGIGIDPKFYDKIFVIFQRLHNNDKYSGTGVGLSIAKKHVEYLGGKIWVDSALEKGTTFYFTISKNQKA